MIFIHLLHLGLSFDWSLMNMGGALLLLLLPVALLLKLADKE